MSRKCTPPPLEPDLPSSCISTPLGSSPKTPPDGALHSSMQSPVPHAITVSSLNQSLNPLAITFASINQVLSPQTPRPPPQTPILNPLTSPPSNPVSPLAGMHLLYSCTYPPKCFDSFNTYDEWVAHEETAHAPYVEIFFCGESYDDGLGFGVERCNAGFLNLGEFEEHLENTHEVSGAGDGELDRHAIGPRTRNFYCGFCTVAVDLPAAGDSGGEDVWAMKRFTHIEDHYLGRNGPRMLIGKWVPIFMVAAEEVPR